MATPELAGARREELTRLVMAAKPAPFWLDRPDAPAAREPLRGDLACDLAVIGGGFSGLWTALLAKEANPGRSVVLIEGNRDRLGGQRPQRRLLRGQPDPRRGQRAGAVPGRVRHAAAARRGEPGRDRGRGRPVRHRLRLRADRHHRRRHRADYQVDVLQADAEADGGDVPGRRGGAGRGELPHLPGRHLGQGRHRHACTRPGSPGDWPPPASGSASGSPSARRPPAWPATPTA